MAKMQKVPRDGYVKCEHCDAYVKDSERSKNAHIGYFHKDVAVERFRQPVTFTMRCRECNELVANSKNVLGRHVRAKHGLSYEEYVVKHERGGTRPTCECGCGREVTFRKGLGFDRFHSKSCAAAGDRNPMSHAVRPVSPNLGKVRTDEHKERYRDAAAKRWEGPTGEKVREIMKGDEYRKIHRDIKIEKYENTDLAEKISKGLNDFWAQDTEEVRQLRAAASARAVDLLEQNKIGPQAPFKAQWVYNPFTEKEEYMHSSYETEFLRRCVEAKKPVTKDHGIKIPYVNSAGNPATYVPDFAAFHLREVHEVKGRVDDDVHLKSSAASAWCEARGWTYVFHDAEEFR